MNTLQSVLSLIAESDAFSTISKPSARVSSGFQMRETRGRSPSGFIVFERLET